MPTIAYRKKCQLLALLCILFIGVIFQRGLQLGLIDSITNRVKLHAIPVAVSVLYHGHPHDYTALKEVALPFQGAGTVRQHIKDAIERKVVQADTYFWVADDRGFADFVIVAFKLFGPKTSSMYLLWFVCLILTTTLYLKSYGHRLWCLGLLGLVLTGVYTSISTLALVDEANFFNVVSGGSPTPISIYEPRFLDVLAMIPVIHICLYALRRSWASSGWQIVALLGQVCLFFLLYHARSSLGWQLVAMIAFLMLVIAYQWWRSRKKSVVIPARFLPSVFLLTTLIAGLLSLSFYKHMTYHPRYFQDMGTRTFWHNALIGLEESGLKQTYQLANGDFEAARAVIRYSAQGNCQNGVAKLDPQGLLNSLGGYGEQDWSAYENCAKKFYFSLWNNHPLRMTYNYLIAKPAKALAILWKVSRSAQASSSEVVRAQFSMGWHPLSAIPLAFAIAILLLAHQALYKRRVLLLVLSGMLLAASLIPAISFYAVILTLGGFFVTLTMLCYLFLLLGARASIRWLYAAPVR